MCPLNTGESLRLALCQTPIVAALAYVVMKIFGVGMCGIRLRLSSGAK